MSELFRDAPNCRVLIQALENETKALRSMKATYEKKFQAQEKAFRSVYSYAHSKLAKSDHRQLRECKEETLRELAKQHERFLQRNMKRACKEERQASPIVLYSSSKATSGRWPIRATSAYRLLAPKRLLELEAYPELRLPKDLPIIHGTGVPVICPPIKGPGCLPTPKLVANDFEEGPVVE
jgi:hypothetical protein